MAKFRIKSSIECTINSDWVPARLWVDGERDADAIAEIIDDEGLDAFISALIKENGAEAEDLYLSSGMKRKLDVDPVDVGEDTTVPIHTDNRLTPAEVATLDEGLRYVQTLYAPPTPTPAEREAMNKQYDMDRVADAIYDEAVAAGEIPATTEPVDEPVTDYDIEILDQGYEPGTYAGWTVQFQVANLPRLSYQKSDPILDAYIPLERAADNAPRLGSGGGAALARVDESERISTAMMGGGAEGNILRGFTGAALVEVPAKAIGNAPTARPSDEAIRAACRKAIEVHLDAVRGERSRLDITEGTDESIVGRKMKV